MTTQPDFRALLADDAYAASFQSMGQYRTTLLKALAPPPPEPPTNEELDELWNEQYDFFNLYEEARCFARAVLERWGNH
jgi:hypothetical protein